MVGPRALDERAALLAALLLPTSVLWLDKVPSAEIDMLRKAVAQKGQTIVPLKLYFSAGYAKLLIAVAKGKKTHDKRHAIAERDARREVDRARARTRGGRD